MALIIIDRRKKKAIDEVLQSLGHSKVSTTVDVYLHTKKGIPRIPRKIFIFEALERILKKILQSIITHLIT